MEYLKENVGFEESKIYFSHFLQFLKNEIEDDNKIILLKILGFLSKLPSIDLEPLLEYLRRELKLTKSKELALKMLENWCEIVKQKNLESTKLLEENKMFLKKNLRNTQFVIGSLKIFSQICDVKTSVEMEEMFSEFSVSSNDGRVRRAGIECLITIHQRGFSLSQSLYQKCATIGLQDDYEEVRFNAMKLVWILGKLYKDEPILISQNKVKTSDDAFIKLCKAVSDWSISCRTQACLLLGRFTSITKNLLMQTFDKKLIKQDTASSSSSSDKKYANQKISLDFGVDSKSKKSGTEEHKHFKIVTKYEIDSSDVSITKEDIGKNFFFSLCFFEFKFFFFFKILGAVGKLSFLFFFFFFYIISLGAFVHGLEDEFSQVRTAAVDSICELSLKDDIFANKAVDFLVDMFNDEIVIKF